MQLHPAVAEYIDRFEQASKQSGQYRKSIGKYERLFLQEVWGPAFQYRFDGLHAEYPFKDFKGGERFVDFVYVRNGIRLVMEIDGFTTHARDISPGDFDDHLMRQNDLVLAGWRVLRFSANQVERRATVCQRQILQSIGHWWTIVHNGMTTEDHDVWTARRKLFAGIALRNDGIIRTSDIIRDFGVTQRTAHNWLVRFVQEGLLLPIQAKAKVTGYRLSNYDN